jgi:uncharacterized SAM-binding protein YcdF (DUF218 family)
VRADDLADNAADRRVAAARSSGANTWLSVSRFVFRLAGAVLLAVLAAGVALWPRLGTALVVSREVAYPDVIVSLASHEWERLPQAARLARGHPDAVVLLTTPREVTPFNCHDCANRLDRLRHFGVPAERVRHVSLDAPGTWGEANAALGFARDHGVARVLVVTSPYHTRRALAVFRRVFEGSGIEVGVVPARRESPARPARWLLAPYDRAYVAYEWAAIVYYAWEYGVPLGGAGAAAAQAAASPRP